jgi:hypothetical protein
MSVEFENENYGQRYQSRQILGDPKVPSMSRFVVKMGLAKNEAGAYKVLVLILIITIIITLLIYYFFVVNTGHAPVPASAIYGTY